MSASAIAADRVKVESTTTGTGNVTLGSAVAQYEAFPAGVCEYVIEDGDGTDWEVGIGSVSGSTLTRTTVLQSSNGDAAVDLSANTHTVFLSPSARTLNRLTLPVVALTDAAVTMTVNRCYRGDISGWSNSGNGRAYTLPDTAAIGDRIRIELTVGDDTEHLLIKTAASGSLVNGVDASTEWSRLFISGEYAEFACVKAGGAGDTDWGVEDGRKACFCQMESDAGGTLTNGAQTLASTEDVVEDVGDLADTTNNRIKIRRAGRYIGGAFARPNDTVADGDNISVQVFVNGAAKGPPSSGVLSPKTPSTVFAQCTSPLGELAVGDYLQCRAFLNRAAGNSTFHTSAGARPVIWVQELL